MARVLIMCHRPFHMSPAEAEKWICEEMAKLLGDGGARRVRFARLEGVSLMWARNADWLLEVEPSEGTDPREMVRTEPCRQLLGDLKLLGMRPAIALAGPVRDVGAEG